MITSLDTLSWAQADLAGNGEFLEVQPLVLSPSLSSLTANVATFTVPSTTGLVNSNGVLFSGLTHLPFLNGLLLTVQNVTSTTFDVPFTHANVSSAGEVGTATRGGALYVVSNVRSNNTFTILKSTTRYLGNSFTTVATYTFPSANKEFAPCIAYDATSTKIHIVGFQNNASNPRLHDLVKFTFNTSTNSLSSSTTLSTAVTIRSGFDVLSLANGHSVVAAILTNPVLPVLTLPTGQSIVVFELDAADALVSTVQLQNSPDRSANNPASLITFNSVSLVSPDGIRLELYWEQHPRLLTFQDQLFVLYLAQRNASSVWGTPAVIQSFTGRYSDDRITVIADSLGGRYLSQTFYTQTNIPEGIVGNLILGYLQGGPAWSSVVSYTVGQIVNVNGVSYTAIAPSTNAPPVTSPSFWSVSIAWLFHETPGSILGGSVVESTISLATDGSVFVAYLLEDLLTGQLNGPSYRMYLASVSLASLGLTDIPGFYNNLNFSWLRGSKLPLDTSTRWAVVAEQQTGGVTVNAPSYISGLNVPPAAVLSPSSTTVLRTIPFVFDASASTDGDGDPIIFAWSENDPDIANIQLASASDGHHATLVVRQTVGGSARTFTVAVAEVDSKTLASVTSVQLVAGTLTIVAANSFSIGDRVGFTNLQQAAFLNGRAVTISSASSTGLVASLNPSANDYGPTTDTGGVGTLLHAPAVITNVSLGGGTLTVTANNTFALGDQILLYGLPLAGSGLLLNDVVVTVLTASVTQFTVSLSGTFASAGQTGFAVAQPQWAVATVSVPFNAAPTIAFTTNPINAARNSQVTITPVYTGMSDADDSPTYQWVQTSGTPVQTLQGNSGANFTFLTNGVAVEGETLVFELTANDGVNNAAVADISIVVPAYVTTHSDILRLSRSIWTTDGTTPASINLRNTTQTWGPLQISGLYTNLLNIKRNSTLDGSDREIFISDSSVTIYGGVSPVLVLMRRLLTPNSTTVLDAVHTELDYTLVLDNNNTLYRYSTAPLINTDNPDTTINLTNLAPSMTFNSVACTVSFADTRIIALSGPQGCLLLQVRSSTLFVQGFLAITVASKRLYGADNVLWLRTVNVENLRSGKVLLGTMDTNGNTYETLVDLTHGIILGNWDKSKLINQTVNSGEILFESVISYAGRPLAPVLNPYILASNTIFLSWTAVNLNLLNGYEIWFSLDGTTFNLLQKINSGQIQTAPLNVSVDGTYKFQIRATSADGHSKFSNTVLYP